MAYSASPEMASSPEPLSPNSPTSGQFPLDQTIKVRGRKRLLQGLQRISSSPSLAKLTRTKSSDYRGGMMASISCVSLSSPVSTYSISQPGSYSSQFSAGYSTAPTSPGSSPGDGSYFDHKMRLRFREKDANVGASQTVPLPADVRSTNLQNNPAQECEELLEEAKQEKAGSVLQRRQGFNFWTDIPHELKIHIFRLLEPKEIIRLSSVSRAFYEMAFDGQLWTSLDCQSYYQQITKDALIAIILRAGAFIKNLNLRGCVQLRDQWLSLGTRMHGQECRNLESFSIEGCKIERSSIHFFLLRNPRLVHIDMPGIQHVNNSSMKIIATNCPQLEFLNIDWCPGVDTKGLRHIVQNCTKLSDLRVSEIRGLDNLDFMLDLFNSNTLQRLIMQNCDTLTDQALTTLHSGLNPDFDPLTSYAIVPPRKLRHLDLTKCSSLTDKGIRGMANNFPALEGLRLCQNSSLSDDALEDFLPTCNRLTHLEIEELDLVTNAFLQKFARSGAASNLEHFSISYCENLGDTGMLPLLKCATNIKSLCVDNTRISDLVLMELADMMRKRGSSKNSMQRPRKGLTLICFDCQNVTWAGVREVLNKNAAVWVQRDVPCSYSHATKAHHEAINTEISLPSEPLPGPTLLYPAEIIALKCFYGYQPTVTEHTKRVLKAKWSSASRLELKWAQWQIANEEVTAAGVAGIGGRRRRRRAREARRELLDDEEAGGDGTDGEGEGTGSAAGLRTRRRRARSGGCVVM
ncbi:MAG: hypothetical protein Q9227_009096 [Pyrenula ochraceoflavens]